MTGLRRWRGGLRWGAARGLALGCLLVAGAVHAAPGDVHVGVAAFERVGPAGQDVPDVASRLAERLGTRGLARVVGPAELGVPAKAEPSLEELSGPAAEAGVSRVVLGRTTRLGNTLSVDARVVDAASGATLGDPLVEEVSRNGELGRAVEGLATQVLARLEATPSDPSPSSASAPGAGETGTDASSGGSSASAPSSDDSAASASDGTSGGTSDGASESRGFDAGAPIAIKSDELEVVSEGDHRKFIFRGNVEAKQGPLRVNSTRLEAFYPPGGSQPERLVATGRVLLEQEGRDVTCERATFFRADQRVECEGKARLDQECDRVRGDKITFFLDKEVMHVSGAADVQLRPNQPGCGSGQAEAAAPGGGSGR